MTRKPNSQNITIRCLTKPYYGLGHFSRCLTLAKHLKKRKYKIHFITDRNNYAEKELTYNKIPFTVITNFANTLLAKKKVLNIMQSKNSKILIIDLRQFSEKFSKLLQNESIKTILLDDAWTKTAYADLVFNGTMNKKYQKYTIADNKTKIFVGSQYFILEPSFVKFRKKTNQIKNKNKYTITISTGGTDPNNVSMYVLNAILSLPKIKIKIIIGPFFKKINQLKKIIKKTKNVEIIQSPKKIWKEFYNADIVISNAGSTLFELATQNIPTLMVAADEHQIPYAKKFSKEGFGIFLGLWNSLSPVKIRKELQDLLFNKHKRIQISKNGMRLVDGKGTSRIVLEIEKFLESGQFCE